ncbi:hypothetical protein IV203_035416 [Nitzschia inconspicua]|uniref:Uncharacterized protein n=1 Tax=Nitzschia inconspicua TaxID=303405 RepID=A0A9K3K4H8_9STRA|nr:hypothetical protein IV203_006793 [Nitzschia inconspicua]KAG7360317.1 hypothetical protein IV203_035416 [Nitzschia inconspicua]
MNGRWMNLLVSFIITVGSFKALSLSHPTAFGSRHLCLFHNYRNVQGPYFSALFDQLLEQTDIKQRNLVYCTTSYDQQNGCDLPDNTDTFLNDELMSALDLDHIQNVILDEFNPLSLEDLVTKTDNPQHTPTIFWVQGQNAFWTRHLLRTSGLDRMIQLRCCGFSNDSDTTVRDCIFVGEGAGARCAGTTMALAHAFGDDPKAAPELQIQGLNVLGDNRWVSFGVEREMLESHSKTKDLFQSDAIEVCDEDQVLVWSQSSSLKLTDASDPVLATKFIMTPHRKGTIERYTTPDPLPPIFVSTSVAEEGVACHGEPSMDPSRAVQNPLGDSEWLEELQ